ncbi:MAG: DNA polymerase III subunit gamma/tau [Chloroflexi bacterium]|nr:MAG: DNA polymerase III subunit gamma/tau [Chloroflexota bacterium]
MSQALYRKWRPARFEEVVGQEHVTRTLQRSVAADRVGHAYLFCGPRGTGKTTTARLLAKAVNCLHEDPAKRPCNECATCQAINEGRFLDLIEIDAASNTGVDDIRDLRDKINFAPNSGRYKVYIIDEVHMLSTAAFNALLKTLEEPPPHAKFVLATTEEHKVPLTIKSRCQQFNFRLLSVAEIVARLQWLAEQEALTIEPEALTVIARQGAGSLRDAESLLDQLVVAPGDTITLERAQMVLGTASDTAVANLTEAWLDGDSARGLAIIHEALAAGTDARQFCRQMVIYLRELLLLQAGGAEVTLERTAEQQAEMQAQAARAPRKALIEAIKRFNEAALTQAGSWQPQLPLELAFIESLADGGMGRGETAVSRPTPARQTIPDTQHASKPATHSPKTAETTPSPPPKPTTTQPEPVTTRPITLAEVTQAWPDMLALVGQKIKNLPPLLNMGKPLNVEGTNTIILGFDYPIFKDKFDKTQGAADVIIDAYTHLLGAKCTLRAVITDQYTIPISPDEFRAFADEVGGIVKEEDEE